MRLAPTPQGDKDLGQLGVFRGFRESTLAYGI